MTTVRHDRRSTRTAPLSVRSRRRFQAITAGLAIAFTAGLAGPAIAASAAPAAPAPTTATVQTHTHAKPAAPAPAKANQPQAPSPKELNPAPVAGGQESFTPSNEQLANAREIVKAAQDMKLPPRAMVIAVATAMQESTLKNLGDLGTSNDHDSLGLFQQRPTSGWGTPEQITDPHYSATAFLKGLTNVGGWNTMPLTDAAQAVQVSAYPDHYAKWETHATNVVLAFYGQGPYAQQAAHLK
jgi:hypothetical protein